MDWKTWQSAVEHLRSYSSGVVRYIIPMSLQVHCVLKYTSTDSDNFRTCLNVKCLQLESDIQYDRNERHSAQMWRRCELET